MSIDQKPLDVDWLWDFIALADHQHFSRAADVRAIAQPALSRHIRSLEEWAGVVLVDRNSHPVALTDAGQEFLTQTRSIVAHLEAARIKARAAHDQSNARLRIASTHSLSLSFFPGWLTQLESRLRLGQVQTLSDSYEGCEELMHQRKVQFVLCYGHSAVTTKLDEATYPMQPMGTDALLPVCAPDKEGRAIYRIDGVDLVPVLEYSESSLLGRILARTGYRAEGAGHAPTSVVFSAHHAYLLKTLALEGRGVAWLPRSLIQGDLAQGQLVCASKSDALLELEIRLYRQKAEMSPLAEKVWQAISS
jgi:DNA-binding transcriptional LysR family regulator